MKPMYMFISGVIITLSLIVWGCTQESQNQFRRSIQNYTGANLTVTIYSVDGKPIKSYEGIDKITTGQGESGGIRPYIYFYDKEGNYVQTNMGYIAEVTSSSQAK